MEFDCAEYYNLMGIEYPLNYQLNETYVLQAEVCGGSKGRIYIDENGKILPINNKSDKFIVIDDIEKDTFDENLFKQALALELKTGNLYIDWIIKAFLIVNVLKNNKFAYIIKDSYHSLKEVKQLTLEYVLNTKDIISDDLED